MIYFCRDVALRAGRVSSSRVVFLGSIGVGEKDQGVRSQGEDKVTDWVKALGQHCLAESDPTKTLLTTNYDQIHHPTLSTHVSSWMLYHFHMCKWAQLSSGKLPPRLISIQLTAEQWEKQCFGEIMGAWNQSATFKRSPRAKKALSPSKIIYKRSFNNQTLIWNGWTRLDL